jgi:hypothetical protein
MNSTLAFFVAVVVATALSSCSAATTPPSPPTNANVVSRTSTSATLSWAAPATTTTPVAYYKIETKDTTDGTPVADVTNIQANVATVTSLTPGHSFTMSVYSCASDATCSTTAAEVKTDTNVPSIILNLSASSSDTAIKSCWSRPAFTPTTGIYYKYTVGLFTATIADSGSRVCSTVGNLNSNSRYICQIAACSTATNECGESVIYAVDTDYNWYWGWYVGGPLIAMAFIILVVVLACCLCAGASSSSSSVGPRSVVVTEKPVPASNADIEEGIVVPVGHNLSLKQNAEPMGESIPVGTMESASNAKHDSDDNVHVL